MCERLVAFLIQSGADVNAHDERVRGLPWVGSPAIAPSESPAGSSMRGGPDRARLDGTDGD